MKLEVEVAKETYELADMIAEIGVAIIEESKDGFQVTDIPVVMTKVATKFFPAIEGINKLSEEVKASPTSFAAAWALAGVKVGKALEARFMVKEA